MNCDLSLDVITIMLNQTVVQTVPTHSYTAQAQPQEGSSFNRSCCFKRSQGCIPTSIFAILVPHFPAKLQTAPASLLCRDRAVLSQLIQGSERSYACRYREGRCNYGDRCSYAHGEADLRKLPPEGEQIRARMAQDTGKADLQVTSPTGKQDGAAQGKQLKTPLLPAPPNQARIFDN